MARLVYLTVSRWIACAALQSKCGEPQTLRHSCRRPLILPALEHVQCSNPSVNLFCLTFFARITFFALSSNCYLILNRVIQVFLELDLTSGFRRPFVEMLLLLSVLVHFAMASRYGSGQSKAKWPTRQIKHLTCFLYQFTRRPTLRGYKWTRFK